MAMFSLSAKLARRGRALFRRFRAARSGVAAVEFALLLPVMLTLYIGGTQISEMLSLKRKISHSVSSIADLVAQNRSISTTAEMTDIFAAGTAILTPFSQTPMKVTVTGVTVDANKKGTVAWAQVENGATCPAVGSVVPLPAGLALQSTFVVKVEAHYSYTPKIGYVLTGTFDLGDQLFQSPRSGKAITAPTC